jgi:hypothetical protein
MGVITRSNHPDALWPGVKVWFGKEYGQFPRIWSEFFTKRQSDKAWEYLIEATGFGLAPVKAEGASIAYDSDQQGYKNTLYHVVYGLGYIVTREELEDNLYTEVSQTRASSLAFSMRTTGEIVHANILNRGFTGGSYAGGDGVALFSTAHPTLSGNQANTLAAAADFSEASLEDAIKVLMQMKNSRGLNIPVTATKLMVHPTEAFNAERVLKSNLRPGTANNDINAIRSMNILQDGFVVNPYLSDLDSWFLKTDVPNGLVSMWRREVELERDNDFDTENAKAKSTMRFVPGWGDWRGSFGVAGA